ncbi:MAG: hypothetical protein IKZ41_07020 [Clostridia bacterium]|nr:hypothetical protein [Clostridia bacterium]MBR5365112.1 hypothetical protein [Clostridia bacterium]
MKKKTLAIILEAIPILSAVVSIGLILSPYNSAPIRGIISAGVLLALFGFVFFFIGRRLAKGDRAVRILGIFDWLAMASIIVLYALAIISFGL